MVFDSPLQRASYQANRTIYKILPSYCLIFTDRENFETFGYVTSQSTNYQREDAGYTNIIERVFYTDRNKLPFTPELDERVKLDNQNYRIKQITIYEPNVKLTLLADLYE